MPSRRAHRWAVLATVVAIGLTAGRFAHADEDRLREMSSRGMEAYDLLEYEEARQILSDAIVFAKRNRLGDADVTARVHINLGIVFFSGLQDENAAAIEFVNALEIDPGIQIPPAYRTEAMQSLLDEIRADIVGGSAQAGCGGVTGLQHALIDQTPAGQSRTVGAEVGSEVGAGRVMLYYRDQESTEFAAVEMRPAGECSFRAEIPASEVRGEYLYYYIAAERRGKAVASSGSAGTPNIIEVRQGGATENPLSSGGGSQAPGSSGPSGPSVGDDRIFVSLAVGSGAGYVTGSTEQNKDQVGCCVAPALFHVLPEIGLFLNPQTSLSAAFRMGFPLGANLPGHAQAAPGGLVRLRYALSETGVGGILSFLVGGGVMRNTVPLSEPVQGGDTDTVASGPLLAGAGVGYSWAIGASMQLVTELNAIAGIPVVECLGDCSAVGRGVEPNFAVQVDANLGLVISF